jgi:quercetin dioxygenase-like cupin family protein
MINRRDLLESTGGLLLLAAGFQPSAGGGGRKVVFEHDLPDVTLEHWAVTAVEVAYQPGQSTPAHRHPGLTFAYVLEGEIAAKIGDEPEKVYTAGQMFMETPGQLHAVSRNASATKPARLLALLLAQKGQPLTTPA